MPDLKWVYWTVNEDLEVIADKILTWEQPHSIVCLYFVDVDHLLWILAMSLIVGEIELKSLPAGPGFIGVKSQASLHWGSLTISAGTTWHPIFSPSSLLLWLLSRFTRWVPLTKVLFKECSIGPRERNPW